MTLNDIIVSALSQLDRGHDSLTVDTWRDKFTRYANEAVTDIATALAPHRSDVLEVSDAKLDTSSLPRCCVKVLSLFRGEARLPFITGPDTTHIRVLGGDGPVTVQYRYLPGDMNSPTDVPELPEYCHGMIVTYVVARERASADAGTQRGAKLYFDLYQAAKRRLLAGAGEDDRYMIRNRW